LRHEKFAELYDKYQPWFNRPIEISIDDSGKQTLKKHLLLNIKCIVTKENNGKDVISNTAFFVKGFGKFARSYYAIREI
jgi:hypothetical protein